MLVRWLQIAARAEMEQAARAREAMGLKATTAEQEAAAATQRR